MLSLQVCWNTESTKCKACIWICHLCYEDVQWLILCGEHFLYALFKITYCFAHKQSICFSNYTAMLFIYRELIIVKNFKFDVSL